jgi:opine dehydrogenase
MIGVVLGNSPLNIGVASAVELAIAGHEVRVALAELPGRVTIAGGGSAALRPMAVERALDGADLVVIDIPPRDLLRVLAPHLGALARVPAVHVNSHGYWPALRLGAAMRAAGLSGFCISDAGAPTHAAGFDGQTLTPHARRSGLRVAAFPQSRLPGALPLVRALAPDALPAAHVIATGLEGINLVIHPALALVNAGWFDRAEISGERLRFYDEGNSASAAALATALDAERGAICRAFGGAHRPVPEMLGALYGATGTDARAAVATTPFYRGIAPQDPSLWRRWLAQDVPYALKPAAALAGLAGLAAPLHAGLAAVFDAILGGTEAPLTLADLGLDALTVAEALRYVETGDRP